jgi:dipeptidyl aminopeptidase/acylaminoacyl peptidase
LTTGEDTAPIPADLYLMNDQKNLYLGARIYGVEYNNPNVSGRGFDLITVFFDSNNNGTYELDEDEKLLLTIQPNIDAAQRGQYADLHVVPDGENNADPHIDGIGRIVHTNPRDIGDYTIEYAIPLNSGDPDDISTDMSGQLRFNLLWAMRLGVEGVSAEAGGLFGLEFTNASNWGVVQLQSGQSPPDPAPQLSGTIAFISSEFEDGRQVYAMNADGANIQSRTQGESFVGTPFLSSDKQRIVYTSTNLNNNGELLPETQEIYTVNTSSGRPRRLTNNRLSDNHPAFSPDGRGIVFARDGNIWVMDDTGRNQRQLTTDGADVDPVWASNGRIVFGSYRWGSMPEVAIMNADGSNITRVTTNAKGSLNPRVSPDSQWITFFRYDGPGETFNFDVSLYHGWNIYRIRTDGTDEQRISDNDGLLNYLPVFSPDGRGVLYQKVLSLNQFYTVLHYIDLQTGQDRQVLNLSRVETFDWR